jgi:hypothetical protein
VARYIAESVVERTIANGGDTISSDGIRPTTGYVFSELVNYEFVTPLSTLRAYQVEAYLDEHREILSQPNRYLGTWVNGARVYFDVVTVEPDLAIAIERAESAYQLAVWSLDDCEEIRTTVNR